MGRSERSAPLEIRARDAPGGELGGRGAERGQRAGAQQPGEQRHVGVPDSDVRVDLRLPAGGRGADRAAGGNTQLRAPDLEVIGAHLPAAAVGGDGEARADRNIVEHEGLLARQGELRRVRLQIGHQARVGSRYVPGQSGEHHVARGRCERDVFQLCGSSQTYAPGAARIPVERQLAHRAAQGHLRERQLRGIPARDGGDHGKRRGLQRAVRPGGVGGGVDAQGRGRRCGRADLERVRLEAPVPAEPR